MGVKLVSSGGGSVEINPPATASSFIATMPAATGSVVLTNVTGNVDINAAGANNLTFSTNTTERARITSGGDFIFGATGFTAPTLYYAKDSSGGYFTKNANTTGATTAYDFLINGTRVGSITTAGSNTTYSTSSDYRLKHDIAPMTGALARVAALKPVTYKWNIDGGNGEGFIAHELQEICPSAVIGEKDAVDADGKPVYQGIDASFLVATLTAAIQELKAINDALTARVAALEGQP